MPENRSIIARTTDGFHETAIEWTVMSEFPQFFTVQFSPPMTSSGAGVVFNERFRKAMVLDRDGQLCFGPVVNVPPKFFRLLAEKM